MPTIMRSWELKIAPREGKISGWPFWLLLLLSAIVGGHTIPPWALMWTLSIIIFSGFKLWTWRQAIRGGAKPSPARSFAYLCAWPGMDAGRFLAKSETVLSKPPAYFPAAGKMLCGIGLIWGVARLAGNPWLAGWIGMIGLILLLHFGLFELLAVFWQRCGFSARSLMNRPSRCTSIGDFWGNRWNSAFRDLAFGLLFRRLSRRFNTLIATLLTFFISGLIHDLVISVPARGGYGLPTAYFILQGVGLLLERTPTSRKAGPRVRQVFAFSIVVLPVFMLFPAVFVLKVIVPFLHAIRSLP